jgi:hypothetical protein
MSQLALEVRHPMQASFSRGTTDMLLLLVADVEGGDNGDVAAAAACTIAALDVGCSAAVDVVETKSSGMGGLDCEGMVFALVCRLESTSQSRTCALSSLVHLTPDGHSSVSDQSCDGGVNRKLASGVILAFHGRDAISSLFAIGLAAQARSAWYDLRPGEQDSLAVALYQVKMRRMKGENGAGNESHSCRILLDAAQRRTCERRPK